jgi:hypothetical protein
VKKTTKKVEKKLPIRNLKKTAKFFPKMMPIKNRRIRLLWVVAGVVFPIFVLGETLNGPAAKLFGQVTIVPKPSLFYANYRTNSNLSRS